MTGCSITVEGEIKQSGGKGQQTEVLAARLQVHGWADPETYPLQKKRHPLEKLREWAHLRPRTNTFGAVMRVRNCICQSIHQFFQQQGFLYVHTPIITASDCEGAGELFRVTTLELEKLPSQQGKQAAATLQCCRDLMAAGFTAPTIPHFAVASKPEADAL